MATAMLLVACCQSGCTALVIGGAGAAGVAGYAYMKGECDRTYPYPIAQTFPAVRDAVASMGLPVVKEAVDELSGRLESRTADGQKVTIELEPIGPAVTKVEIRIGTFGDENAARQILARIDERLPGAIEPPPKSTPEVHVGVSVSN
jgi:hypothetical protein